MTLVDLPTPPAFTLPTPLAAAALTILGAVGDALDASGITTFPYRLVAPGRDVPVEEDNVCAVVFQKAHPGKIGTEQFSGQTPGQNTWPQNVFQFSVELWTLVPLPTIGAISGARPPSRKAMTLSATDLLDAGWVVMAALEAEQFSNRLFPFKPALIGPLEPIGPAGGAAGVGLSVQIQLP